MAIRVWSRVCARHAGKQEICSGSLSNSRKPTPGKEETTRGPRKRVGAISASEMRTTVIEMMTRAGSRGQVGFVRRIHEAEQCTSLLTTQAKADT
jgi:hypothetical protein